MDRKKIVNLIVGPSLFALCALFLPATLFPTREACIAVGTVVWVAYWWITAPVDYAVTGLLPIAINAVFSVTPMASVIANYSNETILLLLGASILTVSWEITGLDKRIALVFLGLLGTSLVSHIVFWFLLSAALSAVLPNAVVTATITPIAVSMLKSIGVMDFAKNKTGATILMTIAWGAGVGGLASPLGGAMNLTVVSYLEDLSQKEYMYSDWVVKFLPIMVILVVVDLVYLILIRDKTGDLKGSTEFFQELKKSHEKMSVQEKICLALFVIATVLSFTRNLYAAYLPGLKPAYVFIICAICAFLVTDEKKQPLLHWNEVQKKIVWSLIYVFAGGLAVGTLLTGSGADACIGALVERMGMTGGYLMVLTIVILTILLSDVTSNTATAAIAVPIVISICNGISTNPIPYVFIASIGVNISYMLPTSIRSVPVGYGMKPSFMFARGVPLTIITILVTSIVSFGLLQLGWFELR